MHVTITDPDNPGGSPAYDGPVWDAHTVLAPGTYPATLEHGDEVEVVVTEPVERLRIPSRSYFTGFDPGTVLVVNGGNAHRIAPDGEVTVTPVSVEGLPVWQDETTVDVEAFPDRETYTRYVEGIRQVLGAYELAFDRHVADLPTGREVSVVTDEEGTRVTCPYGCTDAGHDIVTEVDQSTRRNEAECINDDDGPYLHVSQEDSNHETIGFVMGCCGREVTLPDGIETVWS